MWNIINFNLLGNVPHLSIEIDGVDVMAMDEFKNEYVHALKKIMYLMD